MSNPFNAIKDVRKTLHENGFWGKEAFLVFWDLFYCRKKFHCTIKEYFMYKLYNLKNRHRKNYLFQYHNFAVFDLVNTDTKMVYGKDRGYTVFHDKIAREWMYVTPENRAELEHFIRKHGKVIFKPNYGLQGSGIFAFTAEEIEQHLTNRLAEIAGKMYLCEQFVVQHPKMSALNPGSVNTVRVTTLCDGRLSKWCLAVCVLELAIMSVTTCPVVV